MDRTRVTRGVGAAFLAAALLLASGGAPAALEDGFIPGSGSASANVMRITPNYAGLRLGADLGQSLADFRNQRARGQSRVSEAGTLTTVLTSENCKGDPPRFDPSYLPPTVRAEWEGGESEEATNTYMGPGDGPGAMGVGHQQAGAGEGPEGWSATSLGVLDLPGFLRVDGGRSTAHSSIVDGALRVSSATVELAAVEIAGAIRLEGLIWEVTHRSGPDFPDDAEYDSAFRIGRIEVSGQELESPDSAAELQALFDGLNGLLEPTGLTLAAPELVVQEEAVRLTPLALRLNRSPAGRATVGAALGALQPIREPIAEYMIENDCEAAGIFTLGDVLVAPASGAGGIDIDLGGAFARSEGREFDSLFDTFDLAPLPDGVLGDTPVATGPAGDTGLVRGGPGPAPAADGAAPAPVARPAEPHVALGQQPAATGRTPDRIVPAVLLALAGLGALAAGELATSRRRRFLIEEVT